MLLTEKLPGAGGGGGGGGGLLGGDSTLRDHAAVQSESTQFHRRVDFALRGQTSLQSVRFSTLLSFLRTFPPWVIPCMRFARGAFRSSAELLLQSARVRSITESLREQATALAT